MKNNSILVISNNKEVSDLIIGKINLLRECDKIKSVSYIETISELNSSQPALIILYHGMTDTIRIVKEIRKIKSLNKVPIIFVMDKLEENSLFYAFDNGIDDFFFLEDSDAIILTRIFLTLQKSTLYKQIETNEEILINENIIDRQTGIYTKDSGARIISRIFAKIKTENIQNSVFIYFKPISKDNKMININGVGKKIKELLRDDDIIAYGKGSGFYAVVFEAGQAGTKSIINRVSKALENDCIIYANAAEITTSFEKLELLLYTNMKNQLQKGKTVEYIEYENENKSTENYKINKTQNETITPEVPNNQIEQIQNEDEADEEEIVTLEQEGQEVQDTKANETEVIE